MHMSLFLWLASVLIVRVGGQMGFMFLSLLLPHVLSGSSCRLAWCSAPSSMQHAHFQIIVSFES